MQKRNETREATKYRVCNICACGVLCTSKRTQSPCTLMQCSQLASSSPPTLSRVDVSPSCTEPGGMAKHECEITMPHAATCWRTCIPTCMHARDMLNLRHCTAHIEPPGRLTLLSRVASQPALPCIWQASASNCFRVGSPFII